MSYSDNAATINKIANFIDSINRDPRLRLKEALFIGISSPDGPLWLNKQLAEKRLKSVVKRVRAKAAIPASRISMRQRITDWEQLRDILEASDVSWKDEAIKAIDSLPEYGAYSRGRKPALRKNRLMEMEDGLAWKYMLEHFFPEMRKTSIIITACVKPEPAEPKAEPEPKPAAKPEAKPIEEAKPVNESKPIEELKPAEEIKPVEEAKPAEETKPVIVENGSKPETAEEAEVVKDVVVAAPDSVSVPFPQVAAEESPIVPELKLATERKPFYMSLSTNMLYDALLVPNIGAEFYLGRDYSVAADWMYGWWSTDKRHRYWRIYGGEIALRRWFGSAAARKPLTGHHAGIYAQAITYDFEFGGKGQMAGKPGGSIWDKCSFGVGLEYGYSMPLSLRLNIDFTIGAGYFAGTYYEYRPINGKYVWQSTHKRHWLGPTRAMVSLVWLLGHGNRNEKSNKTTPEKGGGK